MSDERRTSTDDRASREAIQAERDYYRHVADRLGRKSLSDAQDFSRLIRHLRQAEDELRHRHEVLERTVADRTADLVRSNRDLGESTARYDELVRRIPNGVFVMRIVADRVPVFEYLSPRACQIAGFDRDAALRDGTLAFSAAHPDDRERLERTTFDASRLMAPFRWEGRFVVNGEVRWIRIESDATRADNGDVVWSGVLSDVTEWRVTDARLRESEELYRLLNELSPNSVTLVDPAGVIRMANPKAVDLFRHPSQEKAVGMSLFEWVGPECLPRAEAAWREVCGTGAVNDVELRFVRQDGSDFTGEASASLLRDPDGQPKMVIIVVSDTTAKRQAEAERLRLQKLEAIGTLAGGIAHDFNNLLQGVFGYVAVAKAEIHDREKALAILDQAEQAMGQAVHLTSQLLTFAKGGTPRKKRVSLRRTIENAARFALSGSRSACEIKIAGDLWAADVDEGQIAQVIQNIVLNASQAMTQSGTVGITADNFDRPAADQGNGAGRFVRIRVADHGPGIAAEHLSRIFDPYFTTKEEGSGLGLATAHSIVQHHGGTISVATHESKGTTFSVCLPAAAETEAEVEQVEVVVPPPAGRGRVLVMDDEEMVRSVAGRLVELLGYDAVCVRSGEDAVESVRGAAAAGRPFDVAILDLTVKGGMGGEEAIGRIRALTPGIAAVVSSGYSDQAVMAKYRAYGFDACLNKPYALAALKEVLNGLSRR
jgi:two-component system, cell cycle sensor histidine kinase and response regulator CckA